MVRSVGRFDKIEVTNLRWAHPEVLTDPGIYDWPTWHASIPVGYIAMRWGAVIAGYHTSRDRGYVICDIYYVYNYVFKPPSGTPHALQIRPYSARTYQEFHDRSSGFYFPDAIRGPLAEPDFD